MHLVQQQVGKFHFSVRQAGRGEALVLVHGLGATGQAYAPLARELDDHWCIAPDLPRNGGSRAPEDFEASPQEFAVACRRLLTELDVPRFSLAGHSMGAWVALEIAIQEPHRVASLTLIDGGGTVSPIARLGAAPVLGDAVFGISARVPVKAPLVRAYLGRLYGDPDLVTEEAVDGYVEGARVPGFYRTMLEGLRGLVRHTISIHDLNRLKCPAAVIWGERDPFFPAEMGRRLAAKIVGASFHELKGVGHCPQQEAPRVVAEVIRDLTVRSHRKFRATAG